MNGLTVNLHLLLASFWRPQGNRTKILMDAPAFPRDTYALKSHLRQLGFDPDEHLIVVNSGTEEPTAPEVLEAAIADAGDTLALGMPKANVSPASAIAASSTSGAVGSSVPELTTIKCSSGSKPS